MIFSIFCFQMSTNIKIFISFNKCIESLLRLCCNVVAKQVEYLFERDISLYNNMTFLSEKKLRIINDMRAFMMPNRCLACFGASLESAFSNEQKGWIFKRTVRVERKVWQFTGISLEFLQKFEAACKKEGIEILGAEIVYYNKEKSSITPIVCKMDDVHGSCVCNDSMGSFMRAVVLKWRYKVS